MTRNFWEILTIMMFIGCRPSAEHQCVTQTDAEGFRQIFDGKTLDGWKGDSVYWRVENGCLTGEVLPSTILKRNSFIIWQGGETKNFELKLECRISENGNSGINYRSVLIDTIPNALRGYQFDLDGQNNYTGQNYEEKKRTTLAYHGQKVMVVSQRSGSLKDNIKDNAWQNIEKTESLGSIDSLNSFIKKGDWNECHIIVKGNCMQHFINGIMMSEVLDNDTVNRSFSGKLGVQVHVGPPMKVEFRNIRIRELE